jgi:hypothetical protein
MSPRWDELWPAPEGPDDFALRVLVKSAELQPRPKPFRRWRLALAAIIPCLCVAGAFSLSFCEFQRESARKAAILEAQRNETEERLKRLQNEVEAANRRELELQVTLASAKDEVARIKLQAELETTRVKARASAARGSSIGRVWMPAAKAAKKSRCAPGDSLCDD